MKSKTYINKFGVPYHRYELELANGTSVEMDVGWEEHWGNVQSCLPEDCDDWETSIGWGNDADGHVPIVAVTDSETGRIRHDIRRWADSCVWRYVGNYAEKGKSVI